MSKNKKNSADQNDAETINITGAEQEVTADVSEDNQELTELEKAKAELEAQKEQYLRLAAEYENFRKRSAAEKLGIYADATSKAITEILPIIDSLGFAADASKDAPEEYKKGIELVIGQLRASLEKLGVSAFGEIGEEFDPELHNAVSKTEDESLGENVIAAVFQKGYRTGDRIIRYAMVQVAN